MRSEPHPPLVLVVDDDVITSQLIHGLLTRAGYQVNCASNAVAALAGMREQRPDLVLLDINLPDGNGLDICREIQGQPGGLPTPVLFISADGEVASKVRGFEAGGVDYIPKPFAGEEVIARVGTHLRLKQAYETLAELQAERIQRLAVAQEAVMPLPADLPEAQYHVSLRQVLEAGGDFYDVIPVGNRVVDYVVADASGHDLATSFWTAALKTLLSQYATPAQGPREVLHSINRALCRILPEGVYFTMIYARLNRQTGRLVLVNAGHPPAALLKGCAQEPTFMEQEGDVVGSFSDVSYGAMELPVDRGDRFFLFSDGLIEGTGQRENGLNRLSNACVTQRGAPLETMVQALARYVVGESPMADDILLMGIEV
jgi:sigma-B regulation protein RsbU (phosphoserine phosphatase)